MCRIIINIYHCIYRYNRRARISIFDKTHHSVYNINNVIKGDSVIWPRGTLYSLSGPMAKGVKWYVTRRWRRGSSRRDNPPWRVHLDPAPLPCLCLVLESVTRATKMIARIVLWTLFATRRSSMSSLCVCIYVRSSRPLVRQCWTHKCLNAWRFLGLVDNRT